VRAEEVGVADEEGLLVVVGTAQPDDSETGARRPWFPHSLETVFPGVFQPSAEFFRAYRLPGLISSRKPFRRRGGGRSRGPTAEGFS